MKEDIIQQQYRKGNLSHQNLKRKRNRHQKYHKRQGMPKLVPEKPTNELDEEEHRVVGLLVGDVIVCLFVCLCGCRPVCLHVCLCVRVKFRAKTMKLKAWMCFCAICALYTLCIFFCGYVGMCVCMRACVRACGCVREPVIANNTESSLSRTPTSLPFSSLPSLARLA